MLGRSSPLEQTVQIQPALPDLRSHSLMGSHHHVNSPPLLTWEKQSWYPTPVPQVHLIMLWNENRNNEFVKLYFRGRELLAALILRSTRY